MENTYNWKNCEQYKGKNVYIITDDDITQGVLTETQTESIILNSRYLIDYSEIKKIINT